MKKTIALIALMSASTALAGITRNTEWGQADVEVTAETSVTLSGIIKDVLNPVTVDGGRTADEYWTDLTDCKQNGTLKFLNYTADDSVTLGIDTTVSLYNMEITSPGAVTLNFSNGATLYTTNSAADTLGTTGHVSYGINCYTRGIQVDVSLTSTQVDALKDTKALSYTLVSTGESWNYDYCNSDTSLTVAWTLSDCENLKALGYTNKGVVSSAKALTDNSYGLVYSAKGATFVAKAPEPATATLSLLALAGLCGRRRRK